MNLGEFARTRGAKDKKRRKTKLSYKQAAAIAIPTGLALGATAVYIQKKIGKKIDLGEVGKQVNNNKERLKEQAENLGSKAAQDMFGGKVEAVSKLKRAAKLKAKSEKIANRRQLLRELIVGLNQARQREQGSRMQYISSLRKLRQRDFENFTEMERRSGAKIDRAYWKADKETVQLRKNALKKKTNELKAAGFSHNLIYLADFNSPNTVNFGRKLGSKRFGVGGGIVGGYAGLTGGMMALGEHRRRWVKKYKESQK